MKTYKKLFCFIIVACIVFITACEKETEQEIPVVSEAAATKMTIGFYQTETYNPLLVKSDYNRQAYSLIFDSLYNLNSGYEPIDNLASDLYVENGGLSAILQLKPNIKFHDGSELDAQDVVKTIEFISASEDNYYKYNIRNITSVKAENDYTVKFFFSHQTPNIKNQLVFPIVSSDDLTKGQFPLNGTGMYKLKEEKSGKEMVLTLNEAYLSGFSSSIKDIYVQIIPDKPTSMSLSSSGIVDAFFASFYDEGLKTITKTESRKTDYPTDEYTFIEFNYDNELMYLKSFRKALSYAINREKLRDDTFMSHADCVSVPVSSTSWIDTSKYHVTRDLDQAKEILKQIGYEDTDKDGILDYTKNQAHDNALVAAEDIEKISPFPKRLSFSMLAYSSPIKNSVVARIKSDLKDLGVEIKETIVEDHETFMELYGSRNFDMCIITTNVGYDFDLAPFMVTDLKFGTPVEMGYSSELIKLSTTCDLDLKKQVYKNICDKFYENMPHIPLVFLKNTLITNNKLSNAEDVYINNVYYKVLEN